MHENCIHAFRGFVLTAAFGLQACLGAPAQFNYSDNGDGTVTVTGYTGRSEHVDIPHHLGRYKVRAIGTWAFNENSNIKSLTLPESITSIGDLAFENCSRLAHIDFDNNLTNISTSFGGSALTSVRIPKGVISIDGSFWSCLDLENVTIPASVSRIENDFYYCLNLQSITVDRRNSAYSSADGVLFNKDQTELILCPAGKSGIYNSPDTVTSIGEDAFAWCGDLTGIVLPEGVTNIGYASFFSCSGLTNITIPASVTTIDDWTFAQCNNLNALYFLGNAPMLGGSYIFYSDNGNGLVAYYLPGTTGWEEFTAATGVRAVPWAP